MKIIGHGIDLVEIARIARMMREHGQSFLERCFTEAERGYCMEGPKRRDERLAARFAAKEAVLKALGTGWRDGISWRDVEVTREPSGMPGVRLTGRAFQIAAELGVTRCHLSLTHTESHAMASVLAVCEH